MKITKQQLKQIIKEEISEVLNENLTDDMGTAITVGDHLQIVDSDAGYLVLNVNKRIDYNMDVGDEFDTRMIVRVLNIRDPRA